MKQFILIICLWCSCWFQFESKSLATTWLPLDRRHPPVIELRFYWLTWKANPIEVLRWNDLLTVQLYAVSELTQIFESETNLPMSGSDLHSEVGSMSTLACWRTSLGVVGSGVKFEKKKCTFHYYQYERQWVGHPSLPVVPHPKRMAFWSAYWSGSALATGKQTGATNFETTTGVSSVMMAISLA